MENDDICNGEDKVGEATVPYGSARIDNVFSSAPVRIMSRVQLEEETITLDELDCRLTSFIDKHFEAV
ncbi:MAG: hypothetical protein K6D59_09710 [Bacteroidales bacterium]|nr:hypothetical protein [Bacteroidales bacterium]